MLSPLLYRAQRSSHCSRASRICGIRARSTCRCDWMARPWRPHGHFRCVPSCFVVEVASDSQLPPRVSARSSPVLRPRRRRAHRGQDRILKHSRLLFITLVGCRLRSPRPLSVLFLRSGQSVASSAPSCYASLSLQHADEVLKRDSAYTARSPRTCAASNPPYHSGAYGVSSSRNGYGQKPFAIVP